MASTFYERPILNSPYAKPRFHHPLDEHGQPLGLRAGRRPPAVEVHRSGAGGEAQGSGAQGGARP